MPSELDVAFGPQLSRGGRYPRCVGDSNVTIDETLAELGPLSVGAHLRFHRPTGR